MNIHLLLGLVLAGLAAAVLAFVLVRALVRAGTVASDDDRPSAGSSALRQLLVPFGAFVERRRYRDVELDRSLARYEKLVVQAGGAFLGGARASEIFAARYVLPLLALLGFAVVGTMLRAPGLLVLAAGAVFGVMLHLWPDQALEGAVKQRLQRFSHELPQVLDVMRLVSQSGGDLFSAIETAVDVSPEGPVRDELARVVGEVAIGTSLARALANVAERVDSPDANAVFSTMSQAIEMGTGVGENLGEAASLMRQAARTRAQERAQKAVVAMTFPLLLLILPGVFIVLFAPLLIQYLTM